MADEVQRYDLAGGSVGAHRRTPQGGLIADARLTRTGVLTYVNADGSTRRELRHPDEVFAPGSLATLAHAPVTVDHPPAVTPKNWRDVAVGHVAGTPQPDGQYVAAELRLHDEDAIEKAERGDLQELSCGYSCRLDNTPGTFNGEPYDAVQRGITYNHVAAGPPGFGRAGPEVRMRLDSGCAVSGLEDGFRFDEGGTVMDEHTNERHDEGADDVDAVVDAITKARDAMIERSKNAWKTGRRFGKPGGETKSARDVSRQWHANEAAKDAQTDQPKISRPKPAPLYGTTQSVMVPRGYGVGGTDPATNPLHLGRDVDEDDVGQGDAVADARAAMVQRNKDRWKTGKKWDRARARAGR